MTHATHLPGTAKMYLVENMRVNRIRSRISILDTAGNVEAVNASTGETIKFNWREAARQGEEIRKRRCSTWPDPLEIVD